MMILREMINGRKMELGKVILPVLFSSILLTSLCINIRGQSSGLPFSSDSLAMAWSQKTQANSGEKSFEIRAVNTPDLPLQLINVKLITGFCSDNPVRKDKGVQRPCVWPVFLVQNQAPKKITRLIVVMTDEKGFRLHWGLVNTVSSKSTKELKGGFRFSDKFAGLDEQQAASLAARIVYVRFEDKSEWRLPGYDFSNSKQTSDAPILIRKTGGVLQGSATYRLEPSYPQMAKSSRIEGQVTVEVLINEFGYVESAKAISGHPFFLESCVEAARKWEFEVTTYNGELVKVIGTIVFNFTLPPIQH